MFRENLVNTIAAVSPGHQQPYYIHFYERANATSIEKELYKT